MPLTGASSGGSAAMQRAGEEHAAALLIPMIVKFSSIIEANRVVEQAVRRVFPDVNDYAGFDEKGDFLFNKLMKHGHLGGDHQESDVLGNVKGQRVSSVYVVTFNYGNFYFCLNLETWLIASCVNELKDNV